MRQCIVKVSTCVLVVAILMDCVHSLWFQIVNIGAFMMPELCTTYVCTAHPLKKSLLNKLVMPPGCVMCVKICECVHKIMYIDYQK